MKKTFITVMILAFSLLFCTMKSTVAEASTPSGTEIEYFGDGDYLETTISNTPDLFSMISVNSASKEITKTKTVKYKNSNNKVLWSISIKATFTYDGSSAKCVRYSHSASVYAKTWSIKSITSSKNGNSATARAIAIHSGNDSKQFTKTITIKCSKTGVIS